MKIIEGLTNEELAIWFKTSPATIKRRMVLYQINKKKLKKSVKKIYESLS